MLPLRNTLFDCIFHITLDYGCQVNFENKSEMSDGFR
jgi:hypothetical protein